MKPLRGSHGRAKSTTHSTRWPTSNIAIFPTDMAKQSRPLQRKDARGPYREREAIVGEKTRVVNRMKASWFGSVFATSTSSWVRRRPISKSYADRKANRYRQTHSPSCDIARRRVIREQIKAIETARLQRLKSAPQKGTHPMMQMLARTMGIGAEPADMLVHEVLSRKLRDHRAVARYTDLTRKGGRPYMCSAC